MNGKMLEITCPECHLLQPWRSQAKCIHCLKEMPSYTVAAQDYAAQAKTKVESPQTNSRFDQR